MSHTYMLLDAEKGIIVQVLQSVFSLSALTCVLVGRFCRDEELHLFRQRRRGEEGSCEGQLIGWRWL